MSMTCPLGSATTFCRMETVYERYFMFSSAGDRCKYYTHEKIQLTRSSVHLKVK